MAKSLKKQLSDAAELVAICGLTFADAYSVRIDSSGITFQMGAIALARLSRQLEVPRSKIEITEHPYNDRISIHIDFKARGANWCAVIFKDKLPEFYAAIGIQVDGRRRLAVEPRKLEHAGAGSC